MTESATHQAGEARAGLIITGAAAQGPFAAGALTRLSLDGRFQITSVAGASSGALNGAVYAAGLRVNQTARAAELLERLWVTRASFRNIVSPWRNRVAIVREALKEFSHAPTVRGVRFRAVLASLTGARDRFKRLRFEHVENFESDDFRNEHRLDRMAEVCVASAALPFFFEPREVGDLGPFWDGGIVDNTPIGWAVKGEMLDRIIVITPDTGLAMRRRYSRFEVFRLFHMLINERLGRDLHEAESFNHEIARLRQWLVEQQGPSGERVADDLLHHLRWRLLTFLEIRPERDLEGNLLSGFLSARLRKAYVDAGRAAADRALDDFPAIQTSCTPRRGTNESIESADLRALSGMLSANPNPPIDPTHDRPPPPPP